MRTHDNVTSHALAVRSFSLVSKVPDRVARWFGAQGEGLGEEQDFEKGHSAVLGFVSKGEGQLSAGAGNMVQRRRQAEQTAGAMQQAQQQGGDQDGGGQEGGGQSGGSDNKSST